MNINIGQRQASLIIMATVTAACAVLFIIVNLTAILPISPALILVYAVGLVSLTVAYWRGFEQARYLFILAVAIQIGYAAPLDSYRVYVTQAILVPPIIALMMGGPRAIVSSSILTWLIMAQRIGWQGDLLRQGLVFTVLSVAVLVVSRLIMDTALRVAAKNAQETKERAESLRLSEVRYRVLAANLPNSVVILYDRDLRFILVDGPEADSSGYNRTTMVGKTLFEALPETFARLVEPNMRAVLEGNLFSAELPFGDLTYQYNYVPLRDNSGAIIYGMILGQNITARKKAENALIASEEKARTFEHYLKVLYDISIELSKSETFDDLSRRAVELAHDKLGFDRLSLWFLDNDPAYKRGSFGIDEQGHIRDERAQRILYDTEVDPSVSGFLNHQQLLETNVDAPIFNDNGEVIGRGWTATMILQNAGQLIGFISVDNYLGKQPLLPHQMELLTLYGTALGHLCARKRTEEELLESERVAREFQDKLRALHELSLEVSAALTLDSFLYRAVDLGVRKLGFERLSIWLLDDHQTLHGTYGCTEMGVINDERSVHEPMGDDSREVQLLKGGIRAQIWHDTPLKTAGEVVGTGWDALATLWDGKKGVGLVSTDTYLTHQPPRPYTIDLVGLYGNLIGSLLTKKRAEEALRTSEERYRIVTSIISDYAFAYTVDDSSQIDLEWFTDDSFFNITGYTTKDFQSGGTYGLYQPVDQKRVQSEVALVIQGQEVSGEYEIVAHDGEKRWINIRRYPVWDEDKKRVIKFYGAAQDITERKRAEEALKQLNAQLEQRIWQRTAQLEESNKELEAFTYTVSHDLRAPLRAIDGFANAFTQNYAANLPEKAHHYLNRIQANARRMGELIDDLLALSRLGRTELRYGVVNMDQLVQYVLQDFRASGETGKTEFVIHKLPDCEADLSLLRQVFVNLISNAIKYSSKKTEPRIEIGSLIKDDETCFYIKDNGAGFDMQYLDKLFGTFQRLHSDSEFEGTGIGLAIVKRIISRHHGQVWAEGEVDKGATFYFTIGDHTAAVP